MRKPVSRTRWTNATIGCFMFLPGREWVFERLIESLQEVSRTALIKPAKLLSPKLGLGALVCTLLMASPMRAAQPMTLKEAEATLDRCNRLMVGMSLEEAQAITGEALRAYANNRLSVNPNCVVFTSQTGRISGIWTGFWLSTKYKSLRDVYLDLLREAPLCFERPLTYERLPTEHFSATRPIDGMTQWLFQ